MRRCTARRRQRDCSSADAAAVAQRDRVMPAAAWQRRGGGGSVSGGGGSAKRGGGAQRNGGSAVAQHGGCGGFTGTVRECADACAFECHRCADVRVFVLGQGRRDDSVDGIVVVGSNGTIRGNVYRGR